MHVTFAQAQTDARVEDEIARHYERLERRRATLRRVPARAQAPTHRRASRARAHRSRATRNGGSGSKSAGAGGGGGDSDSDPAHPAHPIPLLTPSDLATLLRIARQTVYSALIHSRGVGRIIPPPIYLGTRRPRWLKSDVDEWLQHRPHSHRGAK